jgi:putative phosphoesterase
MRLGVVSDTHGHAAYTLGAIRLLQKEAVGVVIHCGDIGSPGLVPFFAGWPTHFGLGNVDHDRAALQWAICDAEQTCHERFGTLELNGVKIAFLHSDDHEAFRDAIDGQEYDLVCYGHTHKAESHREGRTLVLNPGALYRANPHTFAVVELPGLAVQFVEVET